MGMLVQPARFGGGGSASWNTTYENVAAGSNSGSLANFTLRDVIDSAGLMAGSKIRITLQANASGLQIGNAYIQTRGAGALQYSTTPIQVQFGGSNTASVAANAEQITDEITLTIGASDDIVFAIYCNSGGIKSWPEDGVVTGYYWGADVAANNNPSMTDDTAVFIKKVEVFG